VKTTVKGSKRIEDMLLKIPARPDAAGNDSNENNNELSVVGATEAAALSTKVLVAPPAAAEVVVVADTPAVQDKGNVEAQHLPAPAAVGDAVDTDQVANLRKQIEEKKAALLAKSKADTRVPEGGEEDAAAKAKAVDDTAGVKATPSMKASDYTGKVLRHPPHALSSCRFDALYVTFL
jgi:hypothetical protein